jgi:putative DNA primase/helicase
MDLLQAVLSQLDRSGVPDTKFPDSAGEYWAHCPYHDDRRPDNFSLNGKSGLFKCQSCGQTGNLRTLARHMGIDVGQRADHGITLEEYAAAKRLPPAFLRGLGITEAKARWNRRAITVLHIPYRDPAGRTTAVRRRYFLHKATNGEDNRFRWQRGAKLSPYGLWRLAEMAEAGWILLVEGESDCHTAWLHGIPALGVPGANNWKEAWSAYIRDLDVYVWHEPDVGGDRFIASLQSSIPGAKVIVPPDSIKDLSELHVKGEDLGSALTQLRVTARPINTFPVQVAQSTNCTDLGNAQRLMARHGHDLRYSHMSNTWYVWDGIRWAPDQTGEVERRAKDTVRLIYGEACRELDIERREEIAKWAHSSESESRLRAMVSLAQSEPGAPVLPQELDADPWLFNCLNGTVDLRTGTLRPHRREDLITKVAPVIFDPDARLDLWDRFLEYATSEDAEMQTFLARAAGYSLVGAPSEEKMFFVHGPGAAGKSTFMEAVKATFGEYAATADFETFLKRSHVTGSPRNDIARLAGSRLVVSIEVEEGKRLAEGLVKTITGGDTVTARFMYREAFEFAPQFTLWLVANHAPVVKDDDDAMWRRILRVPFERVVPEQDRDPELKRMLKDPAVAGPAILAWAVRGCLDWLAHGLAVPASVATATESYRQDMDPLGEFLEEYCVLSPVARVPSRDLRAAYEEWARDNGRRPLGGREFTQRLKERGLQPSVPMWVRGATTRCWVGIGLRGIEDDQPLPMGDDPSPDSGGNHQHADEEDEAREVF